MVKQRRAPRKPRTQEVAPPRADRAPAAPEVAFVWPVALADQLSALNRRFKLGLFDAALFSKAADLARRTAGHDIIRDRVLLKSRSLSAEILDLQGRLKEAREAVREGEDVYSQLQAIYSRLPPGEKAPDPRLALAQVRFVADFARLELYRGAKYMLARERLHFCARFLDDRIRSPTYMCHGTAGLISYYTGCAERQLGRLDAADRHYGEAINEYRAKAELAMAGPSATEEQRQESEQELAAARHNTAVILGLGVGWTNTTRGNIRRALEQGVTPGEVLLMTSRDQTHRAYLSLLSGSLRRSLVGSTDARVLDAAKSSIHRALRDFTTAPYCHESYALRAEYELALCELESQDFKAARDWTRLMEERATRLGDVRWQANAWIVRSRITSREGRNPEQARDEAEKALKLMAGQEELLGVIDAKVARAEALLDLGQVGAARQDLEEALETVRKPNQKIEGLLHIMLARAYALAGGTPAAEAHLQRWEECKPYVEHALVHAMAEKVIAQVQLNKDDFKIRWDTTDLVYAHHELRLRRWLVNRAHYRRRPGQTKADVADSLGVVRTTLNNWEIELKKKPDESEQ